MKELVEIYAGDNMKAQMIANLLQENGIPAFVRNEFLGSIAPFYASAGGSGNTSVEVMEDFADEAQNIIKSFFDS